MIQRKRNKSGQVMLLSIMAIGGIFLAATVVAGLLMTSQIRQATDTKASTAAIAAADAGVEWAFYCYTKPNEKKCYTADAAKTPLLPSFTNGASVNVECADSDSKITTCDSDKLYIIRSTGTFSDASRIFEIKDVQPFAPTGGAQIQ